MISVLRNHFSFKKQRNIKSKHLLHSRENKKQQNCKPLRKAEDNEFSLRMPEKRKDRFSDLRDEDKAKQEKRKTFQRMVEEELIEEEVEVYKQEFDEIYSQSQVSSHSENSDKARQCFEESKVDPSPSTTNATEGTNFTPDSRVKKYSYLVELVTQLKKLREIELKFVEKKYSNLES
jgi:hypothetical protein